MRLVIRRDAILLGFQLAFGAFFVNVLDIKGAPIRLPLPPGRICTADPTVPLRAAGPPQDPQSKPVTGATS